MRSPTAALLWEIWQRNRTAIAVIITATVAGRLLDYAEQPTDDPSSLITLLALVSFAGLFGVFTYTEASGMGGVAQFPRRLFTLPVSTLRLIAIPVVTGVLAVELLYGLWFTPLSRGTSVSPAFAAVLLGAFMIAYQAVIWTLERLGPLRLMFAGALAVAVFAVSLLPTWPPSPPPAWRSEAAVGSVVAGLALILLVVTWRHVKALRCGVERRGLPFESTRAQIASSIGVVSSNRGAFRSPAAAQFWYEWRSSGLVLPILVGGALSIIAPWSWYVRDDAAGTLRLLMGAFAMPIVLAIPVGMAFAKPRFWSEDLSLPAFVAIRPLTDEAIIASKLKVAAASVAAAWLQVLAFVALWLSFWANLDGISRLAISWWAFHEQSVASVYAVSGLMVAAAMVLTWRCLVSRLWTGMSGSRLLFMGSVVSIGVVVSASMVLALDRLPEWILDDPARMGGVVWIMAALVSAKGWLAAYSWRMASPRHVREYLLAWSAATMGLLVLAIVLWQVVRIYVALDVYRFQAVVILLALLAVPLVRVGLAPSRVARNRHR